MLGLSALPLRAASGGTLSRTAGGVAPGAAVAAFVGAGWEVGHVDSLVEDLVDATRRAAAASPGERLDPPLLLLDEVANIAPLPSLPNLLADGGGSGINTVAVLQSLAQARTRGPLRRGRVVHAFPDASVPVVQLSINADKGLDDHLELGGKLAPLRRRGVLVIANGNVLRDLRAVNWKLADGGYEWAQRFDEAAKSRVLSAPTDVAALDTHLDYRNAVPTPDHFIPLLYVTGLARAGADTVDVLIDGYTDGSLSMTAYALGLPAPASHGDGLSLHCPSAWLQATPTSESHHAATPHRLARGTLNGAG